jgi:hypothetical protein
MVFALFRSRSTISLYPIFHKAAAATLIEPSNTQRMGLRFPLGLKTQMALGLCQLMPVNVTYYK